MIDRAEMLGHYIVSENATVRAAAEQFGISKSTVHKDVTVHLKTIDTVLYDKVRAVLETNLAERHLRGGQATKRKWST